MHTDHTDTIKLLTDAISSTNDGIRFEENMRESSQASAARAYLKSTELITKARRHAEKLEASLNHLKAQEPTEGIGIGLQQKTEPCDSDRFGGTARHRDATEPAKGAQPPEIKRDPMARAFAAVELLQGLLSGEERRRRGSL